MAKRKSSVYELFDGNEKVYIGEGDIDGRVAAHQADGKRFTRVEQVGRQMSKAGAQEREAQRLETYRRGHGGRNPRYNETDEG